MGDDLNYALNYSYYAGKGHQAEVIGKLYYHYDANGNTIEEREGSHGTGVVLGGTVSRSGSLRMTDRGFGLVLQDQGTPAPSVYTRYYVWDEENRLERTVDGSLSVDYRYGADGQRAVKYSSHGESLYFDSMWQAQTDYPSLRQSKHVYVGSTRVATRLNIQGQLDVGYETVNTYYYHPDHLGSSQLVSDYQGNEYERVEYTPYGESWIEKSADSRSLLPFKFTGKELDSETGLYYYGARYMNPRTSRWVSADPAGPSLFDQNSTNASLVETINWYSYVANNPLSYTDPTGMWTSDEFYDALRTADSAGQAGLSANYSKLVDNTPGLEGFNAKMDAEFAATERSMVGTPYSHDRPPSLSGSDCSGDVVYPLHEMGFGKVPSDVKAEELGNGSRDFVTLYPKVDNKRQGEKGILNLYDFEPDLENAADHVNVGVGKSRRNENTNQIVDASSPDTAWEGGRNASPRQLIPARPGRTNQTWAPFSTNATPVAQGRMNWLRLVEKYWGK